MSYIFKAVTPRFPLFTMAVIYEDYRVPIYIADSLSDQIKLGSRNYLL